MTTFPALKATVLQDGHVDPTTRPALSREDGRRAEHRAVPDRAYRDGAVGRDESYSRLAASCRCYELGKTSPWRSPITTPSCG